MTLCNHKGLLYYKTTQTMAYEDNEALYLVSIHSNPTTELHVDIVTAFGTDAFDRVQKPQGKFMEPVLGVTRHDLGGASKRHDATSRYTCLPIDGRRSESAVPWGHFGREEVAQPGSVFFHHVLARCPTRTVDCNDTIAA
jgi:hypothetical protein